MQLEKYQNVKTIIFLLIIFFTIWFAFWKILLFFEKRVEVVSSYSQEKFADPKGYKFLIDEKRNQVDDDRLILRGWFFKKGVDIQKVSMYVVLHDLKAEKWLILPTSIIKRQDVTDFFHDGHNYDYSGFYTNISRKYLLDKKNTDYKFYILHRLNYEDERLVIID